MGMARLGFVAGVIPQEKLSAFERVLFRATRGNMFLKQVFLLSLGLTCVKRSIYCAMP